jgi:hypothetical protein
MSVDLARPEGPSHQTSQSSRAGWTIVADMTPRELVARRRLGVVRRRIASALVLVVVLCAAAYAFARLQHSAADDEAATATGQTTALTKTAATYAGITQIETMVSSSDAQVATMMHDDVDVSRAIGRIRAELPGSMTIQNISVIFSTAGTTDGSATLDAAGRPTIGSVTISGAGRGLDDLPDYVEALAEVRGFVNVLPTTNQLTRGLTQFSVTLDLNDLLYTHRYDLSKSSAK